MKNLLFFLILFFFTIDAQNNQELFLKGNELYEQQDYKNAFLVYESIKNKGAAVWYNMGQCCAMQEQFVDALLYYKRAAKVAYMPFYGLIQERIKKLEQETLGLLPQRSVFSSLIATTAHRTSLLLWQILFLTLWCFFCLFLFRLTVKKRFVVLSILVMMLGALGGIIYSKYEGSIKLVALAFQDTPLFVGPSDQLATIGILKKGQEAHIIMHKDDWYKVTSSTGLPVGWLQEAMITQI